MGAALDELRRRQNDKNLSTYGSSFLNRTSESPVLNRYDRLSVMKDQKKKELTFPVVPQFNTSNRVYKQFKEMVSPRKNPNAYQPDFRKV